VCVTSKAPALPPPHHQREPSPEYWTTIIQTTFPIGPHSWDWLRTHLHHITLTLFKQHAHTHTRTAKSWFAPVIISKRFLWIVILLPFGLFTSCDSLLPALILACSLDCVCLPPALISACFLIPSVFCLPRPLPVPVYVSASALACVYTFLNKSCKWIPILLTHHYSVC